MGVSDFCNKLWCMKKGFIDLILKLFKKGEVRKCD